MLFSAIAMVYCILYLNKKLRLTQRFSRVVIFGYLVYALYFAAAVSLKDFSRGRMITCFLSTLMFMSFICIWRPFISLIMTTAVGAFFIWLMQNKAFDKEGNKVELDEGDLINFFVFLFPLLILEISVYFQRYRDASKSYQLELAAVTDDLTGLPNMHKFDEDSKVYAAEKLEGGLTPVYMILNIENFQTYNDRFGYEEGNKLLAETGKIIHRHFKGEPYARDSADYFVVLTVAEDYENRVMQIREEFKACRKEETYLDMKAGTFPAWSAELQPRHAIDRARYAMKLLKHQDDVFIREYDEKLSVKYRTRQYVLNNIDKAVENGYIKVYYQPVIRATDGTLCGFEALARWDDPKVGFMSPGQFIPVLEECRQIHKLDRRVYETVCRDLRYCIDNGKPALPTSLNFSRLDFELMDAIGVLENLVETYRIPKEYLHVEITESALSNDVEELQKCINDLRSRGYALWLDDFGAGYSSMNVLKDYHFDLLKIDMEFLHNFNGNEDAYRIIRAILGLAKELHMETLTEGVEDEEAVNFLREAGCGRLQGFYYGKAMPFEEMMKKIEADEYILSPEFAQAKLA